MRLTVGARYTEDEKKIERGLLFQGPLPAGSPPPNISLTPASDRWSRFTYRLGVDYDLSEDVLLYASYSTGYKSGGFNGVAFEPSYAPETVKALEAGLKSQWFDRRLQANLAAFNYDYTNKQETRRKVLAINPVTGLPFTGSSIENAAAAKLYGAELELKARPTPALTFDGALSYLHTRYDAFNSVDLTRVALGALDLSGNQLNRAPKWKLSAGAQYEWVLSEGLGSVTARLDYIWSDKYFGRPFNLPRDVIPSYDRVNARLTWVSTDRAWSTELYVMNLADKDTVTNFFEAPRAPFEHYQTYLPPRTFGAKLRHSF